MSSSPPSTPAPRNRSSSTPSESKSEQQRRKIAEFMKTPIVSEPPQSEPAGGTPDNSDELPQIHNRSWTTSNLRVASERANKLAIERKLHPYQRDMVGTFLTLSPNSRDVSVFINQLDLLNRLESIATTSASFTISTALMDNIKAYVVAVLFSPKLSSYRGSVPRDHVMSILHREGLNLPDNYERDSSVVKVISLAVSEELTQCRSRIKKDIKTSIVKKHTIYELATTLTNHSRIVVTPALCARIAWLRATYVVDPGQHTYWSTADITLELIREQANGDAVRLSRIFKKHLELDRGLYGGTEADQPRHTITAATWQESIDSIVGNE